MTHPTPPGRPVASILGTWRGRVVEWSYSGGGPAVQPGVCVCPTADLMVRGCTCGHWDRETKREARP